MDSSSPTNGIANGQLSAAPSSTGAACACCGMNTAIKLADVTPRARIAWLAPIGSRSAKAGRADERSGDFHGAVIIQIIVAAFWKSNEFLRSRRKGEQPLAETWGDDGVLCAVHD